MARNDFRRFEVNTRAFYRGKVPGQLNAQKIQFAGELIVEFVEHSPVMTGFFRANWTASLDQPRTDLLEGRQSALQRISAVSRTIERAQPGDVIWITNNAEYAPFLEDRYHIVATGIEAVRSRHRK